MKKAAETVGPLGIDCKAVTYDQYDLASFRVVCDQVLAMHPDGVVLAPMFHYESYTLGERLHAERIPFVLVDSKIENKNYLAYYGMQEYASGYLCADQLTQGMAVQQVLIVRISPDRDRQADPTAGRRTGFLDYLAEHCPGCEVIQTFIHPSDPVQIRQAMEEVFAAHPGIRHIVMFNSRIHRIVPFLEANPDPQRRVVGFDNLAENMAALRKGTISVLIGQRPGEQVAQAIQALADYLLLDKKPALKDNHMHMDILTRYNIDYY
jgi:LacI family transcriptional regulator